MEEKELVCGLPIATTEAWRDPKRVINFCPRLPRQSITMFARSLPRTGVLLSKPCPSTVFPSFVRLSLQQPQSRSASILASLSDIPAAYNKRIRRGRGPSSGKGKTSGRGHKGQKQHGKVPAQFNGGQTPDIVVSGERGFKNKYILQRDCSGLV
jgi:hypothetical protein